MMKKVLSVCLIVALSVSLFAIPLTVTAEAPIRVLLNGEEIQFDVPPQMINNRTMVPMRAIFEAFGYEVEWHYNTQVIYAWKSDTETITLTIGLPVIFVNGEPANLDVAPQIVNDRTLVPVRAISEGLNADVDWDGDARIVTIRTMLDIFMPEFDIMEFGGSNWLVLDEQGGRTLLLSERVIDIAAFHDSQSSGGAFWSESQLRAYLNGEFYLQFSAADRARIAQTNLVNTANPWREGAANPPDTTDKIFLLSVEEVVEYFGDSEQLEHPRYNSNRISDMYNVGRMGMDTAQRIRPWWLRTPADGSGSAIVVNFDGTILVQNGMPVGQYAGVRPAMWVYTGN